MLRKRSRSFQKDQYKGHLMSDSSSDSNFQPSNLGQKPKNGSFFSVPGLFVGFSIKGGSDSDSARSPTSPLDYRFFTNLGNPFRSPTRSSQDGSQKSWNCSKVGLGIVDSLNEETKSSGKVLRVSKSRNILFGSQMGINIPSSATGLFGPVDSSMETKSLPKNYTVASQTQISYPDLRLNGSEIAFGTGELQLEPKPLGRIRSCWSDSGRSMSHLTGLTYCDPNSRSENFCSDEKTSGGSPPIIDGGSDSNNFLDVKPSSLPMSFSYGHGLMGSVSATEIELSEDYTCVISHGPNPKTTHIFGDCILECHANELGNCSKGEELGIESPGLVQHSVGSLLPYPSDNFLSFCYFCEKKLDEGKDIYMYRGEKAFCSAGCRAEGILVEEEKEKALEDSTYEPPESTCNEDIFLAGMAVAT